MGDALHNVWRAYQGRQGRPTVEVDIVPGLFRHGDELGWQWRTTYHVKWYLPMDRQLSPAGLDELRFLMTLVSDDDPTGEWEPGKSHADACGYGELMNVCPQDALPLARQVLAILDRFNLEWQRGELLDIE